VARAAVLVTVGVVACDGSSVGEREALPDFVTTRVVDGVYQFRFGQHNTVFVETDDGVVAFDPLSTEAAGYYVDEIRRLVPDARLAAIVYSHRDADHATGAGVLREAFGADIPIVAHQNAAGPITAAADPDLPPPDSTFTDSLTLGHGPRRITLYYLGPSHSDDMVVALLPGQRLVFAVDFVSNDGLGYRDLASFHFPGEFDAIERLLALPFDRVVFGHGPSGDRAAIERQLRYYRDLEAAVQDGIERGLSEDSVVAVTLLPEYRDWRGYEAWRALNVRGMYRALRGG